MLDRRGLGLVRFARRGTWREVEEAPQAGLVSGTVTWEGAGGQMMGAPAALGEAESDVNSFAA